MTPMASVASVAFGATLLFEALLPAAAAQAMDYCMECRAVARFRSCDKPVEGKPVFQVRATRAEAFGCSELLSLDVIHPADVGLPPRIQVVLSPCEVWGGRNGDVIDLAVEEPLSRQSGLYTLACRHW
jgi:hypothetical protein